MTNDIHLRGFKKEGKDQKKKLLCSIPMWVGFVFPLKINSEPAL